MNDLTLFQSYYDYAPLGSAYLAYGLEKENIQFDLKLFSVPEFYRQGLNIDKLCSFFYNTERIIAAGTMSDMLPYLLIALSKIKKIYPKKILILGGIAPTMAAKEILEAFTFIDFIIKGCGISGLPKLIKKIKAGEMQFNDIPGIVFRNKGKVKDSYFDSLCQELPKVPSYQYIKNIDSFKKFSLKTSSGCPYRCTFCYAMPAAGKKIILRDTAEVIKEIKFIKEIKKNKKFLLFFIDEAFVVNKKRVIEFCKIFRTLKLNLEWTCYGRIDRMDEELLKNMYLAGCRQLYYGIESGSERILKKIKKDFTVQDASKVVVLSKKIIPRIITSFIYRYPFETVSDFKETLLMMRYFKMKGIITQLHPLAPVKSSPLYLAYHDRLRFSRKERCDYLPGKKQINSMPRESMEYIENNFPVFYDYGYYYSESSNKIRNLIEGLGLYKP
jgi:radical SAM superfamily enzyme YgiQ (UPF0313 family)